MLKGASWILAITLTGILQAQGGVPSDSEIRQILVDRVDTYKQSVGVVVGVIDPGGRRIISYGKLAAGDPRPLNGDTVFEIGSITKVFTALLLADMVEHHEVRLTDPVAAYLPESVHLPERNGVAITLQDLAMHTSGLPRMPSNVDPADPANPYADYSVGRLYQFLANYQPRRDAPQFEYSNLGGALLGHVLAERAGVDYDTLVKRRITDPLKMTSTRIALTPEMRSRLAVGHAYGLEPTPNWDLGALAAAGALHSTANDLLTFLAANLGLEKTPLASPMASMMNVRHDTGRGEVALAWFIETHGDVTMVSHDGGTGGYQSFIAYDPKAHRGVVVLSNSGAGAGIEDIGIHILNPKVPTHDGQALTPPKARTEVSVDPSLLENYAGSYRFPSGQAATVTREGGHLYLHPEGDVKLAFYAESNQEFFAKIMDAQIRFATDSNGHVTELLFFREGLALHVKRTD